MTAKPDVQQLIPLVVGVTGHRDLRPADELVLREHVARFFDELTATLPQTPICLLSSLADGADRLVAEVALERNIELLVPLPAEQTLYEATFLAPSSVEPFRGLLARATAVWVVPGCQTPADRVAIKVENWQYEALGAFLVCHSHLILALWDGRKSTSPGGTSDVVRFALEGVPQHLAATNSLLTGPQTAQVTQIVTPRLKHEPDKIPRIERQVVWPAAVTAVTQVPWKNAVGNAERRLDEFNRDSLRYNAVLGESRQQCRRHLLPDDAVTSLSRTEKQLLESYANADALALAFQRRLFRRLLVTSCLALLAVWLFQLYFTLPTPGRELIAGYVAVAIVAFGIHFVTMWQQLESKYLDYRALAEGLRVQLFWRMAGTNEAVADHYLSRQQGELSWIRDALRSRVLQLFHAAPYRPEADRQFALVQKHWVEDQRSYFERAAHRNARRFSLIQTLAKILAAVGLGVGVVYAYYFQHLAMEIAVIMLPVLAAVLMVYIRTRKYQEQARQFARMATLYRRAAEQLKQLLARNDMRTAQRLVVELGNEALIENGDWVILHRDRPLEGPNIV